MSTQNTSVQSKISDVRIVYEGMLTEKYFKVGDFKRMLKVRSKRVERDNRGQSDSTHVVQNVSNAGLT